MRGSTSAALISLLLVLATSAEGIGIRSTSGGSAAGPNAGIPCGYRVAYITDWHINWIFGGTTPRNSVPLGAVIDTLNQLGVEVLILGGDWAMDAIAANANANSDSFLAITGRFEGTIWPVVGNHEAIEADTTAGLNPYAAAATLFPAYFASANYYSRDHRNIRFVALQNNAQANADADAYRINNPFYGGYQPAVDWDGILSPESPQRTFLSGRLAGRNPSHWFIYAGHRAVHGDSANTSNDRGNLNAGRDGFVADVNEALGPRERSLYLFGDQHLPLWLTHAIDDSAVASANGKGTHHLGLSWSGTARMADTTAALGPSALQAYLIRDSSAGRLRGRTSEAWADTVTTAADPGATHCFTWALLEFCGDAIWLEIYRTFTTQSAGHPMYTGAGSHRRLHAARLTRDR